MSFLSIYNGTPAWVFCDSRGTSRNFEWHGRTVVSRYSGAILIISSEIHVALENNGQKAVHNKISHKKGRGHDPQSPFNWAPR